MTEIVVKIGTWFLDAYFIHKKGDNSSKSYHLFCISMQFRTPVICLITLDPDYPID